MSYMNTDTESLVAFVSTCSASPLDRVEMAVALTRTETLVDELVQLARHAGVSWTEIATVLPSPPQTALPALQVSPDPIALGGAPWHLGNAAVRTHGGKYSALWKHLVQTQSTEITMTFREIENVIGIPLPPSSRVHLPHWHGYKGSAVARAVIDAGWRATKVDLNQESVTFIRRSLLH